MLSTSCAAIEFIFLEPYVRPVNNPLRLCQAPVFLLTI